MYGIEMSSFLLFAMLYCHREDINMKVEKNIYKINSQTCYSTYNEYRIKKNIIIAMNQMYYQLEDRYNNPYCELYLSTRKEPMLANGKCSELEKQFK